MSAHVSTCKLTHRQTTPSQCCGKLSKSDQLLQIRDGREGILGSEDKTSRTAKNRTKFHQSDDNKFFNALSAVATSAVFN